MPANKKPRQRSTGTRVFTARSLKACLAPLKKGKQIGAGAFGTVSEACSRASRCDRYVVKVQKRDDGLKEAVLLARVNNLERRRRAQGRSPLTFAPKLRAVCTYSGKAALVMQRATTSLEKRAFVTKTQIDSLVQKLEILHANNITHRDIKSDNLLLIGNDLVFGDFGIGDKADLHGRETDWQYLAGMLLANNIPLPPKVFEHVNTATLRARIVMDLRPFASSIVQTTGESRSAFFLRMRRSRGMLRNSRGRSWISFSHSSKFPIVNG